MRIPTAERSADVWCTPSKWSSSNLPGLPPLFFIFFFLLAISQPCDSDLKTAGKSPRCFSYERLNSFEWIPKRVKAQTNSSFRFRVAVAVEPKLKLAETLPLVSLGQISKVFLFLWYLRKDRNMESHHFSVCMQVAFGLKILYQCKTVKNIICASFLPFVFFLYIVHLFLDQTVQQSSSVDVCRVCRYLHISQNMYEPALTRHVRVRVCAWGAS